MNDEDMTNAIKENWIGIVWKSAILFLAFPIIRWLFWFLIYFALKNEWALNKFTESTFNQIIPWYIGIFINFKENLLILVICFLVVWLIYGIMESYKE